VSTTPLTHVLGAQAPGHHVVLGDKVYTARPITQKVKAGFERWLERRVIRGFLAAQDGDDPDTFRRAVEIVADRVAEGKYAFHGKVSRQVLETEDGMLALSALIFGCDESEVIELMVQKGPEVGAILALTLRESFPGAKLVVARPEEGADPKSPGPAA
jgi:hypothetical protein